VRTDTAVDKGEGKRDNSCVYKFEKQVTGGVNTIIGPGTEVFGDLQSGGFTRIDGSLHGDMDAGGRLLIGEQGRLKSNISGTKVTIGGVVRGDVLASEKLLVLSTGLVIGDVITRRIQIDEGSIVHGRITVCPTEEKWNEAVSAYRDAAGVHAAIDQAAGGHADTGHTAGQAAH